MTRVRPIVERMHAYVPGEQPAGGRVIKLNTNENPYPPAPGVIAAVAAAASADLRLYPEPSAKPLREEAARCYGVRPEQVLVGNGSDELLTMLMRAIVGVDDIVVFPEPTYSLYDTLVTIQEGRSLTIPFPPDFTLPPALWAAEGQLMMICNPNAPSGSITPIATIAELASGFDGVVVVDEAYVDFAPASATALPLLGSHDNMIVLRTFSKSFSLAGMRIGLAFGHPDLLAQIAKVKDSYNLNRVAIVAGVAALVEIAWMQRNVARIVTSRARLCERLAGLGYDVLPSAANFVLARRPGEDQGPVQAALRARGILVRHFATDRLRDALRISVGTDEEIDRLLTELGALRQP
ncbi:MAG: histidinol-phosphate aminotransferase [Deltaproteobacteria bacterium]|nr:histidinol-phosphate aminotransferase [Deltaproteobacteria bacterium]